MPRVGQIFEQSSEQSTDEHQSDDGTNDLVPYWSTRDDSIQLFQGDVLEVLRRMPDKSVQCVMTSPPYWALRAYHGVDRELEIGSEKTIQDYVSVMVEFGTEIRRVLRDDGTFWMNIGDTYSGGGGYYPDAPSNLRGSKQSTNKAAYMGTGTSNATKKVVYRESRTEDTVSDAVRGTVGAFARRVGRQSANGTFKVETLNSLSSGNLCGIPWRVALALQSGGWMLRQDIIWHRPAPMPESTESRCTRAHEYIFMFTKSMRYFYDAVAIREDANSAWKSTDFVPSSAKDEVTRGSGNSAACSSPNNRDEEERSRDRNKRSVWKIAAEPRSGIHCAAFPTKLVEPCILSGTSEYGCCVDCGAPYRRVTNKTKKRRSRPNEYVKRIPTTTLSGGEYDPPGRREGKGQQGGNYNTCANTVAGVEIRTLGWEKTCECDTDEVVPCLVLDPFCGSGTTQAACVKHGLRSWGIDLSKDYLDHEAIPRIEGMLLEHSRGSLIPNGRKR